MDDYDYQKLIKHLLSVSWMQDTVIVEYRDKHKIIPAF